MGIPISKHQSPTYSLDSDCFSGVSTVGLKYDTLEINPKLKYDPDGEDWDHGYDTNYNPYDLYYEDRDGDIFDRLGINVFGGSGYVSTLTRNIVMPGLQAMRRIYRRYLRGVGSYILSMLLLLLSYEMFVNRKIHKPITNLFKSKPQRKSGMPDIAREERLAFMEKKLKENKEERLKAAEHFIQKTKAADGQNKQ